MHYSVLALGDVFGHTHCPTIAWLAALPPHPSNTHTVWTLWSEQQESGCLVSEDRLCCRTFGPVFHLVFSLTFWTDPPLQMF